MLKHDLNKDNENCKRNNCTNNLNNKSNKTNYKNFANFAPSALVKQYPLSNKMKETDYDSGASALKQEMNLSRRGCWCKNCTNNISCNSRHKICYSITSIKPESDQKYANLSEKLEKQNNITNGKTDNGTTATTTLILNGANFSKILFKDNDMQNDEQFVSSYSNSNCCSFKPKTNLNEHGTKIRNKLNVRTKITSNISVSNLVSSNFACNCVSACACKKMANSSSNVTDAEIDFHQGNSKNSETTCLPTQLLLRFFLLFHFICDSTVLQHQCQSDKSKQAAYQTSNNSNYLTFPTNKPSRLCKFIVNRQKQQRLTILFMFLIIVSCVNRIEGRPNKSSSASISDDKQKSANTAAVAAVTTTAADVTTVTKKLTSSINSINEQTTVLPLELKSRKQRFVSNLEGPIALARSSFEEDDEHHHPVERYPMATLDFKRVKIPFIIGIWILSASIAKIGFHMAPKLHLIFPESCLLIVVGVLIGVVLHFYTDVGVQPLTPNTFFFYMLPPIILDAGYFMPNRLFFDNLGTILLMAVIGTIFNTATIGGALYACGQAGIFGDESVTPKFLDTFLFAALISAVDPVAVLAVFEEIHVNEILYIVVFGESLLNDAVTVVMYHMMEVYNEIGLSNIIAQDIASGIGSFFVVAIGGTVIGVIWGFLTGIITRFTDHVRVIEPIFIFVMAYLAYLNAEIFHMSGILAITFCGITMKNYVESNISQKSHTTVKYALKMLSSSSETIIFMFLGVATVNNHHVWNTWFVLLTIAFCSVFRVIGVIILTALANRFRLHKLSRVDQFVMSYGGLRGAVAFALVLLIDHRVVKQKDMFVTTTIAVIYFTVFVQGITIKPLVKFLNVKRANKRKPTMNERIHERFMDHLMAGIEDIVGKTGNYNLRDKFKRYDNRFIRPLLIRDLKQGAEPKIMETYSKLTMRDAMEVMRRNPSTIGQITGTESMSALFRNYTNNCIGGRWAPPTIYTTCPSLNNLDNSCSRNLDMHELDYNPSKKDLTDAKIHHLLAEELKPYRRHRRLSYSRHAVDDRDLSTQVNYKMQMNFRRMFNDRKHHKRSKRGANKQQDGIKQNHVSFHDFQQNGSTKQFSHEDYINEVLNESAEDSVGVNIGGGGGNFLTVPKLAEVTVSAPSDDWDDGLTFTAKSSLAENPIPQEDRNVSSRDSDSERRAATPTATESTLPWKRQSDEASDAVQQNEFPAWASNKEYLAYNSPSATFLGGINKPKQPKSVIGLFRRESAGSRGANSSLGGGDSIDNGSARGSDPTLAAALSSMVQVPLTHNPRLEKRSLSISAAPSATTAVSEGHSGPFAVTASHRRNVRRGSMLELTGDTIPEESYQHGHSKSLCEPAGDDWDECDALTARVARNTLHNSQTGGSSDRMLKYCREPLFPKSTPRSQLRRLGSSLGRNQVTTALLSTANSSDYDDDEDEDFDLYDDENIVVTTITTPSLSGAGGSAAAAGNRNRIGIDGVTTTIRLTRNNDESII